MNYAYTIQGKVSEKKQFANNTAEQNLLGDFNKVVEEALMDSNNACPKQLLLLLCTPEKAKRYSRLVLDLLRLMD